MLMFGRINETNNLHWLPVQYGDEAFAVRILRRNAALLERLLGCQGRRRHCQ